MGRSSLSSAFARHIPLLARRRSTLNIWSLVMLDRARSSARRAASPGPTTRAPGRGGMVFVVNGESGAGKTVVRRGVRRPVGEATSACCGVRATRCRRPRPLGPVHDIAHRLASATQSGARQQRRTPTTSSPRVYDDSAHRAVGARARRPAVGRSGRPSTCCGSCSAASGRHVRWSSASSATRKSVSAIRIRGLLGDMARTPRADSIWRCPPLSVEAVESDSPVQAPIDTGVASHGVTGGNAFFVCEMLEHNRTSLIRNRFADHGARRRAGAHLGSRRRRVGSC